MRKGQSSAIAPVGRDAEPGALYEATFHCGTLRQNVGPHPRRQCPTHHPTPVALRPDRGVRAGEGGSLAGFDLEEIGPGAALIAGSIGAAYRLSRRRTGEDGS